MLVEYAPGPYDPTGASGNPSGDDGTRSGEGHARSGEASDRSSDGNARNGDHNTPNDDGNTTIDGGNTTNDGGNTTNDEANSRGGDDNFVGETGTTTTAPPGRDLTATQEFTDALSDLIRVARLFNDPDGQRLNVGQYTLLTRVNRCGETTLTAVADELGYDLSVMSRQAAALVEQGLLVRTRDPRDGRAWRISVTDEGRERLRQARATRVGVLERSLAPYSDDERAGAARILAAVSAAIGDFLRKPGLPRATQGAETTAGRPPATGSPTTAESSIQLRTIPEPPTSHMPPTASPTATDPHSPLVTLNAATPATPTTHPDTSTTERTR